MAAAPIMNQEIAQKIKENRSNPRRTSLLKSSECQVHLITVGNSAVGKTSLLLKWSIEDFRTMNQLNLRYFRHGPKSPGCQKFRWLSPGSKDAESLKGLRTGLRNIKKFIPRKLWRRGEEVPRRPRARSALRILANVSTFISRG